MGILNLNDDILMYTCAYLSSHDALVLALSCKRLCPVALAHVSRHVVLSVTSSLLGGWKYLVAPDRARNIRTLRVRMPKYGYGGKKRPTLWSQAITELIGVARGIVHLSLPLRMLLASDYCDAAVGSIYSLSNLTRLELSDQDDDVLDFLRTFPPGKLQVLALKARATVTLFSTALPAIAHLSGTLRALHIFSMFHLDEAETALEASGKPLVFPHVRTLYLALSPPENPFASLDTEIPYDVLAPFPAAEVVKIPRFQLKRQYSPPKAPTTAIRHLELDPTNATIFACGIIDSEREYDNVQEQCVARYLHVLGTMRQRTPPAAFFKAAYLVQPRGLQLTSAVDVEKTVQWWNAVVDMMPALRCLALEIQWRSPGSADIDGVKTQLRDFLVSTSSFAPCDWPVPGANVETGIGPICRADGTSTRGALPSAHIRTRLHNAPAGGGPRAVRGHCCGRNAHASLPRVRRSRYSARNCTRRRLV